MAALASQNKDFEELETAANKIPSRLHRDFFDGLIDLGLEEVGFSDVESAKKTMIEVEEEKDLGEEKKPNETGEEIL